MAKDYEEQGYIEIVKQLEGIREGKMREGGREGTGKGIRQAENEQISREQHFIFIKCQILRIF